MECDHSVTDVGLVLNSLYITLACLEAINPAMCSSQGIVISRIGATIAFAATNWISEPCGVGHKR